MAPNSLMAILLGMALGGMLATAMRALVITFLGTWFFDVNFVVTSYLQLFAVFMLTMVAL
jgi:ABC-2 type transport system permease protein